MYLNGLIITGKQILAKNQTFPLLDKTNDTMPVSKKLCKRERENQERKNKREQRESER